MAVERQLQHETSDLAPQRETETATASSAPYQGPRRVYRVGVRVGHAPPAWQAAEANGGQAQILQSGAETSGRTGGLRTWLGIAAGGLSGLLIVLVTFWLLQVQGNPSASSQGFLPAVTGASNSQDQGSAEDAAALPPAPIVGRYAPDFTLSTLDGETLKLSDLRGKPVWINFWASWCPPCRAEMPEMQQKYDKYKAQGLTIVGVDVGESAEIVSQYVTANNFTWTFALDLTTEVSQDYLVRGIPVHLFVGKDGVIKAVSVGGLSGIMMERYISMILEQ